jgi:hypothetical protein
VPRRPASQPWPWWLRCLLEAALRGNCSSAGSFWKYFRGSGLGLEARRADRQTSAQPGRAGASDSPTLSERRRRGTLSPQPASVLCRKTFPGKVRRTADPHSTSFRAGSRLRSRLSKGRVVFSFTIRWLVDRTAGPHSTSLRAGSPLRFAPVGITIHILVGCAGAQGKIVTPI